MSKTLLPRWICAALVLLTVVALTPTPINATHNWGGGTKGYHWQRNSSAIRNIPIRRFHSAVWLTRFATAYAKWRSASMTKVRPILGATGGGRNPCPFALNQITSCDGSYGNTGWLGLASISYYISSKHIVQGTSKVNNTYFNQAAYNTVPWRQLVICQEIGHNFGLGHVNVTYNTPNTGSCMDYTNDPDGGPGGVSASDPSNLNPNAHDYALINSKHNHTGAAMLLPGFQAEGDGETPTLTEVPAPVASFNPIKISDLGALVALGDGGRTAVYQVDLGNGFGATSMVIRAR
jgi:hypothetical protein